MGSLLRISTPTVLPSSNRRSPLAVLGELRSAASESALKRLVIPAFVLILLKVVVGFVFSLGFFFRTAIASGLVTVHLRTFSAPLPKRVVLNAFARRMRL